MNKTKKQVAAEGAFEALVLLAEELEHRAKIWKKGDRDLKLSNPGMLNVAKMARMHALRRLMAAYQ